MGCVYKMLYPNMTTRNGQSWSIGAWVHTGDSKGFLAYTRPDFAVMFNPVYTKINKPRLFIADGFNEIVDNGIRKCLQDVRIAEELSLPDVNAEGLVALGIICVHLLGKKHKWSKEREYAKWAVDWLEKPGHANTSKIFDIMYAAKNKDNSWLFYSAILAIRAAKYFGCKNSGSPIHAANAIKCIAYTLKDNGSDLRVIWCDILNNNWSRYFCADVVVGDALQENEARIVPTGKDVVA